MRTKASTNLATMLHDSLQQDFESLEVDGGIPNDSTLVSENMAQESPDNWSKVSEAKKLIEIPCEVDLTADKNVDELMAFDAGMDPPSSVVAIGLRSRMLEQSQGGQEPSTKTDRSASNQASAEPIRIMHPSSCSREPKRFFRTFWRGITARAVAMDRKKATIPE
jgi:hypothetical protein